MPAESIYGAARDVDWTGIPPPIVRRGFHDALGQGDRGMTTQAITANTLYFFPAIVRYPYHLRGFSLDLSSQSAGNNMRIGVYAARPDDLTPHYAVFRGPSMTTAGTGARSDICNFSINPGLWWVAFVSSGTPTVRAAQMLYEVGAQPVLTTGTFSSALTKSFTFGELPTVASPPFSTMAPSGNAFIQPVFWEHFR